MDGHHDIDEKKRAQNRQAQRLYRQRMKEKVKMLQAKVDAFELYASSSEQILPVQRPYSDTPHDEWIEEDLDSIEHILGYHAGTPMHHRLPQVNGQASEGNLCERKRQSIAECLEHENISESFRQSALCSTPLLDKLQRTRDADHMESCFEQTTTVHSTRDFTSLQSPASVQDISSPTEELDHQQTGTSSNKPLNAILGTSLDSGSEAELVEDRLNSITGHARAAGYSGLDSAIHDYYTASLPSGSALGVEQRLSRNRRLPSMIASLSRNAQNWSEWERRGFQEELVKSAETILTNECRVFRQSPQYGSWQQAWSRGEDIGEDGLAFIQEQLPNLTALVTSLTFIDSVPSLDKVKRVMAAICFDDAGG